MFLRSPETRWAAALGGRVAPAPVVQQIAQCQPQPYAVEVNHNKAAQMLQVYERQAECLPWQVPQTQGHAVPVRRNTFQQARPSVVTPVMVPFFRMAGIIRSPMHQRPVDPHRDRQALRQGLASFTLGGDPIPATSRST